MKTHTIKQLADLAGVTVRTLHHYDQIGLLRPHKRSKSNYRYYSSFEALKLQQILFYRELDYSLEEIKCLLEDPHFNFEKSLTSHKKALKNKLTTIKTMLKTIDHTLYQLNHNNMITDDELYAGFNNNETGKKLTHEATEKWGDEVKKTNERIQKMGPKKWKQVQAEGEAITQKLADLMGTHSPDSETVQGAIKLFHKHLENFYPVSNERLLGLANLYVTDDRFRTHYDKYKEGLVDFLKAAIEGYTTLRG